MAIIVNRDPIFFLLVFAAFDVKKLAKTSVFVILIHYWFDISQRAYFNRSTDCFRIGGIGISALHEWLHVGWRNQAHIS